MRRLTAGVIAVAMLGGCLTYQGSRTTAKVGGYMVLTSVAIAAASILVLSQRSGRDEAAAIDVLILDAMVLEVGAIAGVFGLVGMLIHDKPVPEEPSPEPVPDPAVIARVRAKDLTKQAAAASYAGDCATVRTRGAEVREIDPEFHATVFVHIVVIKRCLDALDAAENPPVPNQIEAEPAVVAPSASP